MNLPRLILRLSLGLNFFLHGLVRLLGNYDEFVKQTVSGFDKTILPSVLAVPFAFLIPPLELLLGVALVADFRPRETLIGVTGLMCLLIAGKCLQQDWAVVGSQMIYVLCLYLLARETE
ncbi:MAG: DoxX family membrane protein [Vulcanimicrobiota bacterium]